MQQPVIVTPALGFLFGCNHWEAQGMVTLRTVTNIHIVRSIYINKKATKKMIKAKSFV